MEEQYYDDISIAARSNREQLMKEAEEYRLHRHIFAMKKNGKTEKAALPETGHYYDVQPYAIHLPAPVQ
jgi:hypothetical protein